MGIKKEDYFFEKSGKKKTDQLRNLHYIYFIF